MPIRLWHRHWRCRPVILVLFVLFYAIGPFQSNMWRSLRHHTELDDESFTRKTMEWNCTDMMMTLPLSVGSCCVTKLVSRLWFVSAATNSSWMTLQPDRSVAHGLTRTTGPLTGPSSTIRESACTSWPRGLLSPGAAVCPTSKCWCSTSNGGGESCPIWTRSHSCCQERLRWW